MSREKLQPNRRILVVDDLSSIHDDFRKILETRDPQAEGLARIKMAAVELMAQPAQAKGLEPAAVVQPEVSAALRGDPGRLRQILLNLIGNAIKFTGRGE